jgi:hypothetical protein
MKARAEQNLYGANQGYVTKHAQGSKIKEDNIDAHVEKVLEEVERMWRSATSGCPAATIKFED